MRRLLKNAPRNKMYGSSTAGGKALSEMHLVLGSCTGVPSAPSRTLRPLSKPMTNSLSSEPGGRPVVGLNLCQAFEIRLSNLCYLSFLRRFFALTFFHCSVP
eukprot:Rmarinus@m.24773